MEKLTAYINSPIGFLEIKGNKDAIFSIRFRDVVDKRNESSAGAEMIDKCIEQLDAYFKGEQKTFNLNLEPEGTDFQKSVWDALLTIPYGRRNSYRQIAESLGNPLAGQAVGAANGKNPIAIVVPCHRVIGSKGELTGYAGGIHRKKWLIEHELGIYQKTLF